MSCKVYPWNCKDVLKELQMESIDFAVTFPFYWNLRDHRIEPLIWAMEATKSEGGKRIGITSEISIINYATYYSKNSVPCKTAGDVSIISMGVTAEMLTKAENFFFPNATDVVFQDEGSYAVYKENPKATMDARVALVDKLNEYYFDKVGPLPVVKVGFCYAWNPEKILPWPHYDSTAPEYYEYVRHTQPLNTFRLFDPVPGR